MTMFDKIKTFQPDLVLQRHLSVIVRTAETVIESLNQF